MSQHFPINLDGSGNLTINGTITFTEGIISDDLNVNSGVLFVDSSTNKVSINAGTSPSSTGLAGVGDLQVQDNVFCAFQCFSHSDAAANFTVANLIKSRGTQASPTTVADNDTMGGLFFSGYDGTSYLRAGGISVAVDGAVGTNDLPGEMIFSVTADGAADITDRMWLKPDGSLGIGTSTPDELVEIAGGDLEISSISSGTGTTVVVDANGKILKDSSSLRYKGDVKDYALDVSSLGQLQVKQYKRKITRTIPDKVDLDEVSNVKRINSYKKEDLGLSDSTEIGLIAEEVESLCPELIVYDDQGRPDSIRYDKLSLYLLQAMQDKGLL